MTKEELEKIPALKLSIKSIQEELGNLPNVTDSVTGSDPEYPYTLHTVKIYGRDEDRAAALRYRLERKCVKLQGEISKMEDWLDTLEDVTMGAILRATYRNGLTQGQIAVELGYERSTISKKLKEFFETEQDSHNSHS